MINLTGKWYRRRDLPQQIGRFDQIADVHLVTLEDGAERSVRVLEFRTGAGFAFVIVNGEVDIGQCELDGCALRRQSGAGFVGPWYYKPQGHSLLPGYVRVN